MAGNFTATIQNWNAKVERNLDLVVRQSCQDVTEEMSKRQPSGGGQVGRVPVDTGELINSQSAGLGGGHGGADFSAVAAQVKAGDVMTAVYEAPHAPFIEYGTSRGIKPHFFVKTAVQQWQAIVSANAARVA